MQILRLEIRIPFQVPPILMAGHKCDLFNLEAFLE